MRRFSIIFKQFIQYYIYFLILLGVLYIIIPKPFILGLIIGTVGSLINTYIFELYLSRGKQPDNIHISTGNTWRYLVAIIACVIWFLLKVYVNIIGIMIGLMFSYVLIILRPLLLKS
ncbi:ATP synthase subunit I [Staphylococcus haemolyticus]|uniref:ATP synthase subunit I n=1 Tax=Staphylococcus haemolyticus TaxID=1283 RepID=UPI001D0CE488|nr:ATP synthase subunit I [Staphylococcus haemolyticus]MCC2086782.1 ATP synthase subunit I [Staphylococcus haemolyticus]